MAGLPAARARTCEAGVDLVGYIKASKSTKPAAPEATKFPRKRIPCQSGPSEIEKGRAYASLINSPELGAHRIVSRMQPKNIADDIDVPGMLETLRGQAAAVQRGDLGHAEGMLINQASALQSLFVRLTEWAMDQTHLPNLEAFMRMALRAQSQCRATLETLATINNPPIVYAKQANVTTGPQQVNNAIPVPSGAREIETEQTQLSGGTHELLPDARTPGLESQINPALETLGEINRAEVP